MGNEVYIRDSNVYLNQNNYSARPCYSSESYYSSNPFYGRDLAERGIEALGFGAGYSLTQTLLGKGNESPPPPLIINGGCPPREVYVRSYSGYEGDLPLQKPLGFDYGYGTPPLRRSNYGMPHHFYEEERFSSAGFCDGPPPPPPPCGRRHHHSDKDELLNSLVEGVGIGAAYGAFSSY